MSHELSEIEETILETYYLTPTSLAYTEHWVAGMGPRYRLARQELAKAGYIKETIPGVVGKFRLTPAGYRKARELFGPPPHRTYPEQRRK